MEHEKSNLLSVRPFKLTDVDDFMPWASDEQVMTFTRFNTFTSKAEASKFIEDLAIHHPWRRSICIDDRTIGFIFVHPGSGDERCKADLGYAIARKHWNRGLTVKALKIALPEIFKSFPDLPRLQAFVVVENLASQRVLEKLGFEKEGILRKCCYFKGKVVDVVVFSLLSTDHFTP